MHRIERTLRANVKGGLLGGLECVLGGWSKEPEIV